MIVEPVGGILLTGGSSRRLGRDKATLPVGATTFAERAAGVLREVCTHSFEVGPGVSGLPAIWEVPPGSGPLAAFAAGATAAAESGARSFLLLACDLVGVDAPLLRAVVARAGSRPVVPVSSGRLQYACAWYPERSRGAARRLLSSGERSLRALVEQSDSCVLAEADWRMAAPAAHLADVDTPDDLTRLRVASRAPRHGDSDDGS